MEFKGKFSLVQNTWNPSIQGSSKSSWKFYIMKHTCTDFKMFCTKINLSFNSVFLQSFEGPSKKMEWTTKVAESTSRSQALSVVLGMQHSTRQTKPLLLGTCILVQEIKRWPKEISHNFKYVTKGWEEPNSGQWRKTTQRGSWFSYRGKLQSQKKWCWNKEK